jgi:hypothetical protein
VYLGVAKESIEALLGQISGWCGARVRCLHAFDPLIRFLLPATGEFA